MHFLSCQPDLRWPTHSRNRPGTTAKRALAGGREAPMRGACWRYSGFRRMKAISLRVDGIQDEAAIVVFALAGYPFATARAKYGRSLTADREDGTY